MRVALALVAVGLLLVACAGSGGAGLPSPTRCPTCGQHPGATPTPPCDIAGCPATPPPGDAAWRHGCAKLDGAVNVLTYKMDGSPGKEECVVTYPRVAGGFPNARAGLVVNLDSQGNVVPDPAGEATCRGETAPDGTPYIWHQDAQVCEPTS